jgi:hypothetical protein
MVEINIRRDTASLAERRAAQKERRLITRVIIATSLAVVAVIGGIVISQLGRGPVGGPPDGSSIQADSQREEAPPLVDSLPISPDRAVPKVPQRPQLVDDDGRAMWASPTAGSPFSGRYLPGESQLILAIRPADLEATGETDRIVASLGPRGAAAIEAVERAVGLEWAAIDQLICSLHFNGNWAPEIVFVVTPKASHESTTTLSGLNTWNPDPSQAQFVVASPMVLEELRGNLSGEAALRREFQELIGLSDSQRHVTLLMTGRLVATPRAPLWQGQFGKLRDTVFDWLPDETQAFALSLHWDERFFAELRAVATLDQRPEKFAERLNENVVTWPSLAEQQLTSLSLSPYSRKLVARWPAMLREVVRYTRAGRDERCALLRCYLPRPAGHNLLMAGELLLAEEYTGPMSTGTAPTRTGEATLAEKLQATTSLSFTRDTLEMALQMLSEDSGIPIELVGADLQLDGITKNQSFGLDMQQKPAAEILVEILRQANPDKTATGPADVKQKLVYVVVNGGDGSQSIKVTTRSQAEKRGETLPRVFVE